MAKVEQMNRDELKASRRPIMSPVSPKKRAPVSMPAYAAMRTPRGKDGRNSFTAGPSVMDISSRIRLSAK